MKRQLYFLVSFEKTKYVHALAPSDPSYAFTSSNVMTSIAHVSVEQQTELCPHDFQGVYTGRGVMAMSSLS